MKELWFKEDRELYSGEELKEAIEESKKVLKNSTILKERLERILGDLIAETYREEEDFTSPHYSVRIAAAAGRRKAFKEILKLLEFK